jgi:hypothetical protein
MSDARETPYGVEIMIIVKDGQVIAMPATVAEDRSELVRADGTMDPLVEKIAARQLVQAEHLIWRMRGRR